MFNRRDFLKLIPSTLAAGLLGKQNLTRASAGPLGAPLSLSGVNLSGWTMELGDALYNRPNVPAVSRDDIKTLDYSGYSELRANVHRRIIQAHNITHNKIIAATALTSIHTCVYRFRLPYIPRPEATDLWNGETIEGGIFVWDGAGAKFDYGLAFQWVINPWSPKKTFLNTWVANDNDPAQQTKGKWVKIGNMALNTNWHTIKMTIDVPRQTAAIVLDGKHYPTCFSRTSKPGWGTEVAARLQAECISIWPEPAGLKTAHRAQFKNWTWAWEPS